MPWLILLSTLAALALQERASVVGTVKDPTGAGVAKASVALMSGDRDVWGSAQSDAAGRYEITNVAPGRYVLRVRAAGFRERRHSVRIESGKATTADVVLGELGIEEEITVTADRGGAASVEEQPQPVTLIPEAAIAERVKAVVAQAATEEASVHLQRTSPTLAGIYVRGLTGKNVNVFVDGVRYTTSAQRGGINTFLDLIEPQSLESIEVLRGPQSAQYGSDALGGSIQFQTRAAAFSSSPSWQGRFSAQANSADQSWGGSLGGSYAARRFGLDLLGAGRRVGKTRPGEGVDSRNAVTRFLGLPSSLATGERISESEFDQYAGQIKAAWSPADGSQLRLSYLRSQQDGGQRWDQLLGGDGNLVADLRNLMLDNFQLKYDRLRLGAFDELSLGYSWNAQREERVNQGGNGNPRAAVTHEYEKMRVHGVQALLRKQVSRHSLALGGEYYHESMTAPSFSYNPVTGAVAPRRGRVPDGAKYRSGGVYVQDLFEAVPEKLQLQGALRYSGSSYRAEAEDSTIVNGQPLWPDDQDETSSVTFRASALFRPAPRFSLTASVGRGYRAPHITDLGTYGLTGSGYEIAGPEVAGRGATIGSSAAAAATSTGIPVTQVEPETSLSYDVGVGYRSGRVRARVGAFLNDIDENIVKLALILPPGAVGQTLNDQVITAQAPGGAVFVPASTAPVLVRANYDDARIYGIEGDVEVRPNARWTLTGVFTYMYAKDKRSGLPPNMEGGTPAPDAWLKIRYQSERGRFWVEPYLHAAAEQDRLSTLDLEDRRTGATRSRASIASFFTNGATARGLVGAGADGRVGTADDVLNETGETVGQVQARVLGTANSAPLFSSVAGYALFGVRGGARFGRHELLVDFDNIGDASYRGVSWGIDAPGRGVYVRYATRF
jgi:outer membrane receptor protein involved in Fe transport